MKCEYYFEIGHEGNPIPCCEKRQIVNVNCLTCKEWKKKASEKLEREVR